MKKMLAICLITISASAFADAPTDEAACSKWVDSFMSSYEWAKKEVGGNPRVDKKAIEEIRQKKGHCDAKREINRIVSLGGSIEAPLKN